MAEEVKLASSPLPSSSDLTQFDGQSDAITSSIDHAEIESIEPLTYRLNQFRMVRSFQSNLLYIIKAIYAIVTF